MNQNVQPHGVLSYLIPLIVFAVIFSFRARRMTRERPLKLGRLWLVPAIYLVIVVASFSARPPTPVAWLLAIVALVIGAAIGWQRGRMMAITVDPGTGTLRQKGSPVAALFLFAIIGIKLLAERGGAAAGFDAQLVTDIALAFGLGMFTTTRIEMYLRAKRLLAA
jgi:NAD/NADP transhydrogenase beta subunit